MFCQPRLRRRNALLIEKRNRRSGIATVEFALCLPLLALICFGSIQLSSTILLRHKSVAILEIGTLDYMLGNLQQEELEEHLEDLSENFKLIGAHATATQEVINGNNYLRVEFSVPVAENLITPKFVSNTPDLKTSVLLYRP